MTKIIERNEVLLRVRFKYEFYNAQKGVYRSEYPTNCNDKQLIRYDKKDWIEVTRLNDNVYFHEIVNNCILYNLVRINVYDLMHLTDCGYGFLKLRVQKKKEVM